MADDRDPAANISPNPLDPPGANPGIRLSGLAGWARLSTALAIVGWTIIVALSLVEQRGAISFNPNHHSALMSFASVNLINAAVLWAAVTLAGRQNRQRTINEERFTTIDQSLAGIVAQLEELGAPREPLRRIVGIDPEVIDLGRRISSRLHHDGA